jgi:hypothetical protein
MRNELAARGCPSQEPDIEREECRWGRASRRAANRQARAASAPIPMLGNGGGRISRPPRIGDGICACRAHGAHIRKLPHDFQRGRIRAGVSNVVAKRPWGRDFRAGPWAREATGVHRSPRAGTAGQPAGADADDSIPTHNWGMARTLAKLWAAGEDSGSVASSFWP